METKKVKEINPARLDLIRLSDAVSHLVDNGTYSTINEALVNELYKDIESDVKVFKTFKGWLDAGFIVKKGSKGYKVWSNPIRAKAKEDVPNPEPNKEPKSYKLFGLAYIFSNQQVESK
jgi:hypothetical protein